MDIINRKNFDLFIYGAGGHAKVIIEIFESNDLQLSGIYDDNNDLDKLFGYKVLGSLKSNDIQGKKFLLAIGNNTHRKAITEKFQIQYFSITHPDAIISKRVNIGDGTVVMSGVIINASTKIGDHVIINTSSVVEHDVLIKNFVHVSSNATVCGGAEIGEGALIGAAAVILPEIKIGKWSKVGAGAVITKDVPDNAVVVGVPGRGL